MKSIKKFIGYSFNFAAIGTFIGLFISLIFNYIFHSQNYYPSAPSFSALFSNKLNAVLASFILWSLIGILFGFGSFIFKISKWSLRKRTIINFLVYYFGFICLASLTGWFSPHIINYLIFTVIFIIIYVIIWLYNWHVTANEIKRINQQIKNNK